MSLRFGWWSVVIVALWSGLASAQSYNSTFGFTATQGANQWSYLDGAGTPMVYDGTYAGGAWHSVGPNSGDWCYISSTQQHPGTRGAVNDSIRRWTAPYSGTVTIVGSSKMSGPNGGDGAFVIIRRNGGQLFRGLVDPSDTVGQSWTLTSPVAAGDTIDTVVNRGVTYNNDEQRLTQTITYQGQQFGSDQTWSSGFYGARGTAFADVTGDGRADAIALTTNAVSVRRSNGTSFDPVETWSWDPTFPPYGILFADVNGDSRADMVRIESMSVDVRLSTGLGFAAAQLWTYSPFTPGTVRTTLADVTGDGAADLIAVDANAIRVRESAPLASRFIAQSWWSTAASGWRTTQFADVNADGKADVISVDNASIRVGLSDGIEFGLPVTWSSDVNPPGEHVFADVDGDRRADAIVLGGYSTAVTVRRARSTSFAPSEPWTAWPYYGTRGTFIADVTGDANHSRADAIAVGDYGIVVRRAPTPFGAIDPPATAGHAIRLSTFDLRGTQANTSAVFDPAFVQTSTVAAVDRTARANSTTIVAYVASNGSTVPNKMWIQGTIRTTCEGYRGSQGIPGAHWEISVPLFELATPATPKAALAISRTIDPNSHSCANGILRNIRVEAQAFAVGPNQSLIAMSSTIRFTLVRSLKVMTWNIEGAYAVGTPDQTIWDIGNVIDEERLDVAALQEVHVNFQPASNFLDELAILRSRLAPFGLSSDTYQPRCAQRADSSAGLAIFSRLPFQSTNWEEYGFVRTSCAGGFNKHNELHGTQSITVALGDTSLVFGNTHWPLRVPWGYTTIESALIDLQIMNVTGMETSPFAYLMSGDFNAGNLSSRTVLRADLVPGVTTVGFPPPNPPGLIDHMYFKSMTTTSITPVETYFRYWDYRGTLSDHLPRVTMYTVE